MNTEAIVYLARKLHWSLGDIGKLSPTQFGMIYDEVRFQEETEHYRTNYAIASVLAAIYNTIPRTSGKVFSPEEFITLAPPRRRRNVKRDSEHAPRGHNQTR